MRRNLDGVFFRIGSENICFSDLTEEQQEEMMEGRSEQWLKNLCKLLAQTIRQIGDQFSLVARYENEEEEN